MDATPPEATVSDMASDDHLVALRALRDSIIADVEVCESMRDKTALYARLESVLKLIPAATPETAKEGDPVDEITARRTARGGATSRLGHAQRGS